MSEHRDITKKIEELVESVRLRAGAAFDSACVNGAGDAMIVFDESMPVPRRDGEYSGLIREEAVKLFDCAAVKPVPVAGRVAYFVSVRG